MDVVFSYNNNEKVMVLPVVMKSPQIKEDQKNGDFDGLNGPVKLIGPAGLRTGSLSGMFPSRAYHFMRPGSKVDPWGYVAFFREVWERRIPARIVIIFKRHKVNMACLIDDFSWEVDKAGDVVYSLSFTEYVFPTARRRHQRKAADRDRRRL